MANLPIWKEQGKGYLQEVYLEVDDHDVPVKATVKIYPTAIACACEILTDNKCRKFDLLPD